MAWSIRIHSDPRIIETIYTGTLSAAELKEAIQATMQAGEAEQIPLFLGDCSSLAGGHSVIDLYEGAKELSGFSLRASSKEAILIPETQISRENVEFWETTCFNRGFRVKLFTNRSEAISWLLS